MCLDSDYTWISRSSSDSFLDVGPTLLLSNHSWSSRPQHWSGFGTESIWFKYLVSGCGGFGFFLGVGNGGGVTLLTTAGGGLGLGIIGFGIEGGGLVVVTGGDWAGTWFVITSGNCSGEGLDGTL
ncbi:hypothetical protein Hanom_Chr16g01472591 [Helianthus anomalus]